MKLNITKEQGNKLIERIFLRKQNYTLQILLLLVFVLLASASYGQENKVFRMSGSASISNEVPLQYSDSRQVTVFFKSTPEAIRKLIPQPLVPNPDNIMIIMAAHWNAKGFQSSEYNDYGGKIYEVALCVPVRFGKTRGVYAVILYLDNASRLPMSREIWGFPKKLADVTVDEKDGIYASTVKISGTTLVKLDFKRTEKVEPVPVLPPGNLFNLKMIPSIKRNAPPEVLQITAVKTNFKTKQAWKGKATFELGSLVTEPLGGIPVLKIMSANDMIIEGSMDYGEVLYDYLAKGKN
ncbi:MAG: acetoacetate decarboxylase family protein [Syntrophaceae bacterium]